ncbi:MAG TPA: hypothetical protein VIU64_04240 [Polyangia bacterium]
MGQPRIIEVPYQAFLSTLQRASNAKKKIDFADKERWNKFVREHNIPEAGMAVKARSGAMSGKTKVVIIDGDGKADGYYIYSSDDQFCLKYDLGRE